MSLDLNTATARIVREMSDAESAIAQALVATTALLHSAAVAQRDVGTAPIAHAYAALARLTKMTTGLLDVQGDAHRVHGHLLKIGVETGAMEEPTCPDNGFTSATLSTSASV